MSKVICKRCIYDETVPGISFGNDGVCNYCAMHDALAEEYPNGPEGERRLEQIVERIKEAGAGKPYDCVVGVSGGCDSSYMLYRMKELGLRPLAAHFDNTWNSTIATSNIRNVTRALDVDLYTYVVNNKEYDDLYRSFLRAGVIDVEAPTDIGLATTLFQAASQHGIKYVIEGHSFRTEGVAPLGWIYMDARYIADVQKRYGSMPLTTFPNLWLHRQLKWMAIDRIRKIRPLYYMEYDKEPAKKFLHEEFGWEWYGGHHLENRFTAFWHRYLLPIRWDSDPRLLGFSALVRSGQMNRDEALAEMERPPYEDPEILEIVEFVKKRLGFSEAEFDEIMHLPRRTWREFKNYRRTFRALKPVLWAGYRLDMFSKTFYVKYTAKDFGATDAREGVA